MSAGDADGAEETIELTATGADEATAIAAGLSAVLAAARAGAPGSGAGAAGAAAIRGQGANLAQVVAELVNDLLAQLDANGAGLDAVRLDGLLRTDDGYTAWGYLVGDPTSSARPVDLSLAGLPVVERAGAEVVVRIRLHRG